MPQPAPATASSLRVLDNTCERWPAVRDSDQRILFPKESLPNGAFGQRNGHRHPHGRLNRIRDRLVAVDRHEARVGTHQAGNRVPTA